MGAVMMAVAAVLMVAALGWLVVATGRSIRDERTRGRSVWREFGLSFALITLFFASWIGQTITQWQLFTDQQHAQGLPVKIGDFLADFGFRTLRTSGRIELARLDFGGLQPVEEGKREKVLRVVQEAFQPAPAPAPAAPPVTPQ